MEKTGKIWLKSYPPGVPPQIDASRLPTLQAFLETCCERYGDAVAFVQMDKAITYRQFEVHTRIFGAWLQSKGLRKGDRIALMMPNLLQYPIAVFGALRAGLVVVNINPLYTAREVGEQLRDSGASLIVVLEGLVHVVEQALEGSAVKTVAVTGVGDLLPWPKSWLVNRAVRRLQKDAPGPGPRTVRLAPALRAARRLPLRRVTVEPADLAFLQYTGGTTGVPKAAMLTHANLCANILQSVAWIRDFLKDRPGVMLTALPLYHIFALELSGVLFALGWRNVLVVNARNIASVVAEMRKRPVEFISGVNTLFNALMSAPGFSSVDFSRLRITLGGGMAVQPDIAQRWRAATGCVLTQAWGLTETSPGACINPCGAPFDGSVGLPIPSTEVAIKDEAGQDVGIDRLGEICVRGPQVMAGYWNRPDETAKVMLPGGWLRTGDIGRMDDRGHVFVEDRKKDVIVVSGFNVYPNEIEAVATTHPGIREAAVVAKPDSRSGESVALFAVRAQSAVSADELIDHCRKSLAAYKVPKHIYFKPELPKTPVGKILRRALREELSQSS